MATLKISAPGLFGRLSRIMSPEDLSLLDSGFLVASNQGALLEPHLTREPGASFNPYPARICEILAKESGVKDTRTLLAAMFSCALINSTSVVAEDFAEALELATAVSKSFINRVAITSDQSAINILNALVLDHLRHLHMTDLEPAAQKDLLDFAKNILSNTSSTTSNRLHTLIDAAVKRYER